ncbi:hypothetical protein P609_21245 [Comamonas thiooxydans]|nr:hypothetical protein P609_21245 [Comamonas thiooxydans]
MTAERLFGAGVLWRLQSGQRVLVRPVVKIANQPASRADLPRLRQVVLPYKALKGLPGQARQLGSDFFGDDLGSDCLGGTSLIQL